MTSLKETLEATDSAASQAENYTKTDAGRLRSDAVSLDVPVKVHGSRVTEVVRGVTPHTGPFEEQTSTMIVFPLGGVLRMSTPVSAGQAIVLTNLKSRQDAICRVVKVRTNPNMHSYVEIEFTHPQPGYWGVHFSSDGPGPAKTTTLPVSAPVSIPAAPAVPPTVAKGEVVAREEKMIQKVPSAPLAAPPRPAVRPDVTVTTAAPSESFSMAQLRGDAPLVPAESFLGAELPEVTGKSSAVPEGSSEAERAPLGRLAAGTTPSATRSSLREAFGTRLQYGSLGTTEQATEEGQGAGRKWLMITASVVVLLAAVGGAAFYFRFHSHGFQVQPAARAVAAIAPPAPAPPVETNINGNTAPTFPTPTAQTPPVASPSVPIASPAPSVAVHVDDTTPVNPSKPSRSTQSESNAPTVTEKKKPKATTAVPDMFGALNAHPVSSQRESAGQSGVAPSINAGPAGNQTGPLPEVGVTSVELAPVPQPVPDGPVPVGGDVPAPRAIYSVAPVYPGIAREANAQGNVVVRIVIDKTGKVTEAKAVSGAALLRRAAEDALLSRRYEPSKLKGQPVSVEMLVTIQFHL